MVKQLPEQKYANNKFKYVDTELLGNKQNSKAFRGAAYTIGIATAFIILSVVLPSFDDKRVADMIELIRSLAWWMLAYAVIVVVAYFKMRKNMRSLLFMLNWFMVPTIGLWFIMRVMDIFSNMPPELQP
jgi:hypothetical protein